MVYLLAHFIRNTPGKGACHRVLASAVVWAINRKGMKMRTWTRKKVMLQAAAIQSAIEDGMRPPVQFYGLDLSRLDLSGLDLSGLDFDSTDCTWTDFSGSNLAGSSFVNATLTNAKFVGTDCYNCDFRGASVTGADFTNANTLNATCLRVEHLFVTDKYR